MNTHLGKIALMVAMSHGFRALGRASSPRWAGLILGLPCTTAVALVGSGSDRGIEHALVMSGMSLIGLAGAVTLPVAFARATAKGWRLPWAIGIGVFGYLAITLVVGRCLQGRAEASLGVALMAVLTAAFFAGRTPPVRALEPLCRPPLPGYTRRLLRSVVPVLCLLASLNLGDLCGPAMAGLMSTFPGVTLTVLCLTYLESGPGPAVLMARSLPAGNFAMVAFLAAFRAVGPAFGLGLGTLSGYLAALATLGLVLTLDRQRVPLHRLFEKAKNAILPRLDRKGEHSSPSAQAWPRASRRFSPRVETFVA